jgi:hypothetical protein
MNGVPIFECFERWLGKSKTLTVLSNRDKEVLGTGETAGEEAGIAKKRGSRTPAPTNL